MAMGLRRRQQRRRKQSRQHRRAISSAMSKPKIENTKKPCEINGSSGPNLTKSGTAGGNAGGWGKHARNIPEVPADYPAVPAANDRVRNFVEVTLTIAGRHMMEAWASHCAKPAAS